MLGDQIEHALAVAHPAGIDGVTEHRLGILVVLLEMKGELGLVVGVRDRPTGESPRGLAHVVLGVAAVDAQRMQLEQLARIVLVEAAGAFAGAGGGRRRRGPLRRQR